MISYLKYLDDNLAEVFNKEMEEYRKYVKLYYTENSKCPADMKSILEKEETKNELKLWCNTKTGKNWNVLIKKPNVINLNIRLLELTNIYNNEAILFKNLLKNTMNSSVYIPEKDKDIEKKLIHLKVIEGELESVREIFDRQNKMIEEIINNRQEVLKKLFEIKIKKNNIFTECPRLDNNQKKKLIEISKNEKNISVSRLDEISKNVELKPNEVKNWVEYFRLVSEYIVENEKLNNLNKEMISKKDKFEKINSFFIIDPPIIELSEKSKKSGKSSDESSVISDEDEKFKKIVIKKRK